MTNKRSQAHPFWRFFIDNFRITYILLVAVVIFGVVSVVRLPKESAPEVDIPVAVITTSLSGAGAQNVEKLVTDPLEKQISGISEVTTFTSVSEQGLSSIQVQYDTDSDSSEVINDLRTRVDRARAELPDDAGDPRIQKVSFSDQPILTLALSGPLQPAQLKRYAEEFRDELEGIGSVSQVVIRGAPEREIRVTLDQSQLDQFGVSSDLVSQALAQANTDVPIGSIETGGIVYSLRFDGRFTDLEDVGQTAVAERSGSLVLVEDLASIEDTFTEQNTINRYAVSGSPAQSTVSLQLFKQSGEGNILTITDRAREIADRLQTNKFPEDIEVEVVSSDAEMIKSDLATLATSGLATILIIFSVLAAFLGWREALLASLVVPISFLITFVIIEWWGLTINFLTLFSLILSLGIIVDAAIVVIESIFQKRLNGARGIEAAIKTINEFQAPLIAGTMTTVLVFLPMLLTSGIIGEFIVSIPITVSVVLMAALFVSLGVVTTLATRFLPIAKAASKGYAGAAGLREFMSQVHRKYSSYLEWFLTHKKAANRFLAAIIVLFFISLSFPFIGLTAVNMFPAPDSDLINIDLEAPVGTPLAETDRLVQAIEAVVSQDDRVESYLTTVGQGSQAGSLDVASVVNSHIASVKLNLADRRAMTSKAIEQEYQERFEEVSGAEVTVSQPGGGPEQGSPVQVQITGEDLNQLENTADRLGSALALVEGAKNVDDGLEQTVGEFAIEVDKAAARYYGVTPAAVARTLRTAVSGNIATDIKTNDEDIDIKVTRRLSDIRTGTGSVKQVDISEIRSLLIQTSQGSVPLDSFADITLTPGRSSINHTDGDRVITLRAQTREGVSAAAVVDDFKRAVRDIQLPAGITISYGGETEDIQESFTDLAVAMVIGVFGIFTLMVWQFRSYLQPLFIVGTIPLALTGVFLGLALVRQPLSFPAFIGIVALSGVAVNNAIILLDAINKERLNSNQEVFPAVLTGARSRLQPVLLTTITTVTGLVPLTFSDPTWSPVAYSMIFGLLFATVITLFVVPVLYSKFPGSSPESILSD